MTLLPALLLFAACGGSPSPSTTEGGSSGAPPIPKVHRPVGEVCPSDRPPGTVSGDPSGEGACSQDADCSSGMNGRCVLGASFTPVCSYDQCESDSDCGAGICDCRNEAYASANTCFQGSCVTDADCGGRYCSPSATRLFSNCRSGIPAGSFGYFCHTPEDECTDDEDCPAGEYQAACLFSAEALKWTCFQVACTQS